MQQIHHFKSMHQLTNQAQINSDCLIDITPFFSQALYFVNMQVSYATELFEPCSLGSLRLCPPWRPFRDVSNHADHTHELIQTTYQFINVVNGVSRSHKTANICFSFDSSIWRIWRHRDFAARGFFKRFIMTDSERATMTFWQRSTVTLHLGCMVSEITRFYCKAEMTSSWFIH